MSFIRSFLVVLLALVVMVAPALSLAAESGVAKVGNITITEQDVQREMQKLLPMQVGFHGGISKEKVDEIKQEALQNLITRAYKVQYAITEEIAVDPKVMEEKWQAFYNKYANSFKAVSEQTVSIYRADMYLTLLAEKAEDVAVAQNVNVSDDQVAKHYSDNMGIYYRPKLYSASHVFVKVDPSSNT